MVPHPSWELHSRRTRQVIARWDLHSTLAQWQQCEAKTSRRQNQDRPTSIHAAERMAIYHLGYRKRKPINWLHLLTDSLLVIFLSSYPRLPLLFSGCSHFLTAKRRKQSCNSKLDCANPSVADRVRRLPFCTRIPMKARIRDHRLLLPCFPAACIDRMHRQSNQRRCLAKRCRLRYLKRHWAPPAG